MNPTYVFTLESEALDIVARVNSFPLVPNPGGRDFYGSTAINEWLMPGTNTLTVQVNWPEDVDYEPNCGRFSATVTIAGTEALPLAAITWPSPEIPETHPQSFRLPFSAAGSNSRAFRNAGTPSGIDVESRSAALSPVMDLHAALAGRDLQRVLALLYFRFSEIESAYPEADSSLLRPAREAIEDLLAAPEAAPAPIEAGELSLEPVAGGKLFHVLSPDGRNPIHFELSDGMALDIPVFVGFVDGEWVIAR